MTDREARRLVIKLTNAAYEAGLWKDQNPKTMTPHWQGIAEKLGDEIVRHLVSHTNKRMCITERHEFDDREGDISNAAWRLHVKQKKQEVKINDMELRKLLVLGKSHTAKLAEGGDK